MLSKAITTTVTLYAKWGYAITFNSNGGSETDSIIDVGGAEISAPDEPEKTGYVFSGWFTDDGTFEDEFIFETMPQQNITLYAEWELYNIGLSFTLINNDSEYEVSCGTCQDEEIITPAQYQGKPVTSISDGAFEDNSKIISAILPDTIKNIGNRAFRFRKKLEQVNIPESVESIGDSAFEYCEKLTSVMISKKVSHIGSHAFAYCKEVTSFTVNEDNQNFKSVEGNLYSKDGTKLI